MGYFNETIFLPGEIAWIDDDSSNDNKIDLKFLPPAYIPYKKQTNNGKNLDYFVFHKKSEVENYDQMIYRNFTKVGEIMITLESLESCQSYDIRIAAGNEIGMGKLSKMKTFQTNC